MTAVVIVYHKAFELAQKIVNELKSRDVKACKRSVVTVQKYTHAEKRFPVMYLLEEIWFVPSHDKVKQFYTFIEHCKSICGVLLPSPDLSCDVRRKAYVPHLLDYMLPGTVFCDKIDDIERCISTNRTCVVRLKPGMLGEGKAHVCLGGRRRSVYAKDMLAKYGSFVLQPNIDAGMFEIKIPVLDHKLIYNDYVSESDDDDVQGAIKVMLKFAIELHKKVENTFKMPSAYRIDICTVEDDTGVLHPYLQELEILGALIYTYRFVGRKIEIDISKAVSNEVVSYLRVQC